MKIKELKLFNSVKCGPKEVMFLKSKDGYDMELINNGPLIRIIDGQGNEVLTSLYNAPWLTELKDSSKPLEKKNEPKKSTRNTKGAAAKKGKPAKVARS